MKQFDDGTKIFIQEKVMMDDRNWNVNCHLKNLNIPT